jgi:dolichol-phosphate mannosyltransferase
MADFRLLDRQVVDSIREFREEGLFLRGLVQWMGFDRSVITYQSRSRERGETKYTLGKMLQFSWRGITSFSTKPLRVGIILGVLTSFLAFLQLAYAVYSKLVTGAVVPGWASAVSIVSLLFGILFILVGLIGEYLGRVLIEVRGRPRFLMRDRVGIPAETRGGRDEG